MNDTVALAYCHPHRIDAGFHTSMWRMLQQHPRMEVIELGSGPMIASARNELAFAFLDYPGAPDWMFMVDADMAFPPDLVDRLLDHADRDDTPILGALCFVVSRTGKIEPTLKVTDPDNGGLRCIWDYPEDALVSVDATGGACLLVHRSVFERLHEDYGNGKNAYPFFADAQHGGYEFGEDVTFCLRARKAGFPVKVHTGIEAGHIKPYVYTSADYKAYRARLAEVGEDQLRTEHLQRTGLLSTPGPFRAPNRQERRALARR